MQGVLAYVFVRPSLAAIQLTCMLIDANNWGHDTWGEGKFTLTKPWLWCMLINNVTQVRIIAEQGLHAQRVCLCL
jgi:hypothetical protein